MKTRGWKKWQIRKRHYVYSSPNVIWIINLEVWYSRDWDTLNGEFHICVLGVDSVVRPHLFIKIWGTKMWTIITWPETVTNVELLCPRNEISAFSFMNISEFTSFFHRIPCSQFFVKELQYTVKLVGLLSYAVIISFSAISLNFEKPLLASSCLSVRLSTWNNSIPTGWIFVKFHIWLLFGNLSGKFTFLKNMTIITGTLRE